MGPNSKNIYLLGMMGSGKSTVGRLLAPELGRGFVDLDELIAQRMGKSLAKIFADEGEPGFRDRESAALREVAQRKNLVVALGGGAILRDENFALVQRTGVSVYLRVRPELLHARLENERERPLLLGLSPERRLAKIIAILSKRAALYEQADITVRNEGTPAEAVALICEQLRKLCTSSASR